ncbi:MAG: methyltransferase [Xanthobacteraceae bacterium]|nr:methyltransferase [Xanthobacteraceae bacterium]
MRSRPAEAPGVSFAVTDDAVLGGRLKLVQPARGHRAGHDAILLAAAAPKAAHAVDLGAGIGTAGLALLVRGAARRVTLVEIDKDLAALARANSVRNGFVGQTAIVIADVASLARRGGPHLPKAASADLVLANPPFNDPARRKTSPDAARKRAYMAKDSDLETWARAADRLLKPGGTFVLIHRPEAMATILAALAGRFGAAELVPIHPRPGEPAIRLLVRAKKGRRTPPMIQPGFVLADAEGRPSLEAEAVLRGVAALNPRLSADPLHSM